MSLRRTPACAVAAALALALAGAALAPRAQAAEPGFAQVKAAWRPAETTILDRHGQPVQSLRTDLAQRRGAWVPLAEISWALRDAVIAAEDRRFSEHAGVDWPAVAAAAVGGAGSGRTRGASTITMQLAGLIDADLAAPKGGRSVPAKLAQAAAALRIERHWRKDEILEAYLNLVPFRGELVGVGAMSAALFQKRPAGLYAEEAAVAAALLRAPNAAPAQVGQRACALLKSQGRATACVAAQGLAEMVLAPGARPGPMTDAEDAALAPHFARQVLARPHGPVPPQGLRTTLDARTQRLARDTLREQLAALANRSVEDGAVVVLDNASGDVLAWVGSSGGLSRAAEVDAVLARRQAGSTLKPFLYAQAIEARFLTAASLLDDAPTRIVVGGGGGGQYVPQNYDHDFKGPVSVRTALGASLNVPAVRTLVMVGPDAFARRLVALGLPLRHPGEWYGYSLALGSAEVDLLSLANAYRALANGGRAGPPRLTPGDPVVAARPVLAPAAAFVVADILADNGARVPTFGLDSVLATPYPTAVKTGTSKDMRDNWCVGFSGRFTVGVWVGNASGEPMHDVSGVTGAAPVWRAVMDALQRPGGPVATSMSAAAAAEASRPGGPVPAGVERVPVRFAGGLEAPRDEWFLAGTAQARIVQASAGGRAVRPIVAPEDHAIVALDPDIPPDAQKLRFAAAPGQPAGARWRLDGRPLGPATPRAWALWPGAHRLELQDSRGKVLDAVAFEVRGARLRAPSPS